MALYTTKTLGEVGNIFDDIERQELERQQRQALEQYNASQAKLQQAQSKQMGPLESVLTGIGNSIKNVGDSLGNMFGTGLASLQDLVTGNAMTGKYTKMADKYFKEKQYGDANMSDKDYFAKTAGKSLDAAVTLSDLIPVAGGAKAGIGKIVSGAPVQIGQGVLSGVAQQYAENGENATLEDALRGGLVGGASSGVGRLVGGKLAGKTAGKGLLSKAVNSNIGKAAITGATAGATGGGLNAALSGGDLGQILAGAGQGAQGGALAGGTMAGIKGLMGAGIDKLKNRNATVPEVADTTADNNPSAHRQKALGWDGEEIDASTRNKLQTLGKELQDAGERTKNADVYGKLNNNTARDIDANDTINRLKKEYGYSSKDYDRAANLSEATNRWIKNELQTSGASGYDQDLVSKAYLQDAVDMTDNQLKSYNKTARQLLTAATVDGGGLNEYSAAGLYDASEKAGKLANTYYEKAHNKMDGSVINPAHDELATAYRNLRDVTRAAADNMVGGTIDDTTRSNLVKMLKSSGAPDEAVKTLSKANSFAELKSMTSPLEQARNINKQINQTMLKRGATTDATKNPATIVLNKSGVTQLADTLLSPVGKVVGGVENMAGKALTSAGNFLSGGQNIANGIGSALSGIDANAGLGNLATRQLVRQSGLAPVRTQANEAQLQQAQQQAADAENLYNNTTMATQAALQNLNNAAAYNPGEQQLATISKAMELALNAGDFDSYNKLADLYQQAYKMYGSSLTSATGTQTAEKLTDNQTKALNGLKQLEQLSAMTPGVTTALANSPLAGLVNMFGGDEYANQAQALALTLGYLQSGANVSKTEAENIGKSYIPNATDSEQVRAQKLERARELLNNYLYGTQYYQG